MKWGEVDRYIEQEIVSGGAPGKLSGLIELAMMRPENGKAWR